MCFKVTQLISDRTRTGVQASGLPGQGVPQRNLSPLYAKSHLFCPTVGIILWWSVIWGLLDQYLLCKCYICENRTFGPLYNGTHQNIIFSKHLSPLIEITLVITILGVFSVTVIGKTIHSRSHLIPCGTEWLILLNTFLVGFTVYLQSPLYKFWKYFQLYFLKTFLVPETLSLITEILDSSLDRHLELSITCPQIAVSSPFFSYHSSVILASSTTRFGYQYPRRLSCTISPLNRI